MCKAGFYWRAVKVVQCGVKNVVADITAGAVAKVNRAALLLQAVYMGVRGYGGILRCRRALHNGFTPGRFAFDVL